MSANSKIEWTHHTFNPWRGCTKVSAGCAHCYADTLSKRNPGVLGIWGPNGTRVVAAESYWRKPLKWDAAAKAAGERHRVFCASLADVFEGADTMPLGYDGLIGNARARLFQLIMRTPHLDWLLLTKRPENIMPLVVETFEKRLVIPNPWPLPNVWVGTSVEDQKTADERIPHLLRCPAAVRFLSVEPLLGAMNIALSLARKVATAKAFFDSSAWKNSIDLVIVGGESGPGARPCDIEWIRSIIAQCKAAGVACFVKQLGSQPVQGNHNKLVNFPLRLNLQDRKGGNPSEWPEDLRVREMPGAAMKEAV